MSARNDNKHQTLVGAISNHGVKRGVRRNMILLSGPLSEMPKVTFEFDPEDPASTTLRSAWDRSPSLWWPEDRSWCVGTDTDLNSSYVGATRACIEALCGDHRLEIMAIDPMPAADPDRINPKPHGAPYT